MHWQKITKKYGILKRGKYNLLKKVYMAGWIKYKQNLSDSLTVEYFKYHKQYADKFGKDKTVVLVQVGSFYEAYATQTDGPNLDKLEEITDVVVTRRNSSKAEITIKNPYMWGFPLVSATKYIDILINNGYHVIVVDQVSLPPNTQRVGAELQCSKALPCREVTAIYSPGTYIDTCLKPTSNFIVGLFIEELPQKGGISLTGTGMAALDCSTGELCVHEICSALNDEHKGLDETVRFVSGLAPKELVIFTNLVKHDHIIDYLDLEGKLYQIKPINSEYCKVPFQKKFLEKVYAQKLSLVNVFEDLHINTCIFIRNALVSLLTYVSDHQSSLVTDIALPTFYIDNSHLVLGNDAVNQLNILSNTQKKGKYDGLCEVINKASTNMGKRFITMRLASPLVDEEQLRSIYDRVEKLIKNSRYQKIDEHLKNICDIERLYHYLMMGTLHPMHLVDLHASFKTICNLFVYIETLADKSLVNKAMVKELNTHIIQFSDVITNTIKIDTAKLYRQNDIRENIFKEGYDKELDELEKRISLSHDAVQLLLKKLNDTSKDACLVLKHNKRDGYFFQTTKKRYINLQKCLSKISTLVLDNKQPIAIKDLVIDTSSKVVKISAPFLKDQTCDIDMLTQQMANQCKKIYLTLLENIKQTYSSHFKTAISIITDLDYLTTVAKVAKMYNYVRPTFDPVQSCAIKAHNLRHPLVERLIDHEYIPHDIDIGHDIKGMLIYGLNSAGKSVLMKAIGIAVIMAQAGFFVAASSFVFSPYKAIYTRITGNDNIFRGLSSFALEMVELNAILKRADKNTLVIGDEVCRGTEHISGNAIVAASLLRLSELDATFVFATHLHEICDEIKDIPTIKAFHLSVEIDSNGSLLYDRKLKPGSGEQIYGITVAKHILHDTELINKALEIKNKILNKNIISTKKSRYNAEVYVDKCELCGKIDEFKGSALETHHINKQSDCVDGFVKEKPHIKKNSKINLMAICNKCHDNIHAGKIDVSGYKTTHKGTQLVYHMVENI